MRIGLTAPVLLLGFLLAASPAQATSKVACVVAYNANYAASPQDVPKHVATLKRHKALFEKLGLKGDYWFTWLAADMIGKADPTLIPALRAAGHGLHHHGANRPPSPTPIQRCKDVDFWADVQAVFDYETHDIDPVTGKLIRSRVGGMLGLQQIYRIVPLCDGRMVKAQVAAVERAFGARMGVGFGDNSGLPHNQGWFMGLLGRPESTALSPPDLKRWALHGGPDPRTRLESFLQSVPNGTFAAIAILMHDWDWFRNLTPTQEAKVWQAYEQVIRWAKNHARLKIVTIADLWRLARDDRRPLVTPAKLDAFAANLLAQTGSQPSYPVTAGGESLSLADLYVMLVEAVVLHRIRPGPPWSNTVSWEILGPLARARGLSSAVTLAPADVEQGALDAAVAVYSSAMLYIPPSSRAGRHTLNATELLFAMARFYRQIYATGKAGAVRVGPRSLLPALHPGKRAPGPLTQLQHWTWKPARFALP